MMSGAVIQISHPVEIRTARESDAELICGAVTAIASEKRYLASVDGFSLEDTRAFLKFIVEHNQAQATAFAKGIVVGFCDILPNASVGFSHVARLGMGVRIEWRRQGIGRRLLDACLALTKHKGIEKVELEVFSDNIGAVKLYQSFGFSREGVKLRGRKLDDRYQDVILMALWIGGLTSSI